MVTAKQAGKRPEIQAAPPKLIGLHLAMKARQAGRGGDTVGWCRSATIDLLGTDSGIDEFVGIK